MYYTCITNCMPLEKSRKNEGAVGSMALPGNVANNTKIKQTAYRTPLSQKIPNIPTICSMPPPKSGPSMRVAFPVAESSPIAFETF